MGKDACMDVAHLHDSEAARLRSAPYTYGPVGHTATGPVEGFDWFERSATLERRDFDAAAKGLLSWQVQVRAGLRVVASHVPLEAGSVVLMRLGRGPLSPRMPCRVVYVIEEPDLRGFAYGTLPGHPESGEERFALRRHGDGSLVLTISAFSRPASRLARLGGPLTRRAQELMTSRYLRALDAV